MKPYEKQNFITIDIDNIDTDQIIGSEFLVTTERSNLRLGLFNDMKYLLSSTQTEQLNSNTFNILVTGSNFGCGSSREHAVWALKEAGFDYIIAESFADIFKSNAYKNGLLPIELEKKDITQIKQTDSPLHIELISQLVLQQKSRYHFQISSFLKTLMINKQSEFDYLLSKSNYITEYEKRTHV